MKQKILCMGSVNIDLTMYMKRLPETGETVVTDNFATFPGGKGGNQAAVAASLGGDVRYFTKLGDDAFSNDLIVGLKARGVDMSRVIILPGDTAGVAMIRVDSEGHNSISFTPGANAKLTPQDVRKHSDAFDGCGILLITMEIPVPTVYEAIQIAKEKGMTVIVDPSPVPANGIPAEICSMIDYAKPNETEAETLSGVHVTDMQSALLAFDHIHALGIHTPIISMSDKGAFTKIDGKPHMIEPIKVEAVDSTAAGDVFLGAFAAAFSQGKPLDKCLHYANTAAALSTTRKGAQTSIPSQREVDEALQTWS